MHAPEMAPSASLILQSSLSLNLDALPVVIVVVVIVLVYKTHKVRRRIVQKTKSYGRANNGGSKCSGNMWPGPNNNDSNDNNKITQQ